MQVSHCANNNGSFSSYHWHGLQFWYVSHCHGGNGAATSDHGYQSGRGLPQCFSKHLRAVVIVTLHGTCSKHKNKDVGLYSLSHCMTAHTHTHTHMLDCTHGHAAWQCTHMHVGMVTMHGSTHTRRLVYIYMCSSSHCMAVHTHTRMLDYTYGHAAWQHTHMHVGLHS